MSDKKIPVIEIFGPVIQGEGSWAGRRTHFLRTGGCDYRCSWCDSIFAVDPGLVKKNSTMMTQEEIVRVLVDKESDGKFLTISGGNPAIHDLSGVVETLQRMGWLINVETQGTLWRDWLPKCDYVTVSPKSPSSKMKTDLEGLKTFFKNIDIFGNSISCKIVVFDIVDYNWAKMVLQQSWLEGVQLYIQPGTPVIDNDKLPLENLDTIRRAILYKTKLITEWILKDPKMQNVRVIPQLHALVYGHERCR